MSQLVCSCGQQHGRVRSRLWTPARSCIMGSLSCRDHHQRHHHHHRGSRRGQCSEWGDVYRTEDQLLRWLHRWRVVLLQPKILLHLLHWIHLQRLLLLLKLNWFELPFQNIAKLTVVDILRLITLSIFDNFFIEIIHCFQQNAQNCCIYFGKGIRNGINFCCATPA